MALDASEDIALSLKKRARRRLVGSIALVLLLLVVLPNVLKNRLRPNQSQINVIMPETLSESEVVVESYQSDDVEPTVVVPVDAFKPSLADAHHADEARGDEVTARTLQDVLVSEDKPQEKRVEKMADPVVEKVIKEVPVVKAPKNEKATRYLVQLGVFSEPENVERLQVKITAAGFSSNVSKINTAKGEMIRLRVGTFVTREAAANALSKLKQNGLSGMVMTSD